MPAVSMSRSSCLASVPEDDLLQKQRSIKRIGDHRSSSSLPSIQQPKHLDSTATNVGLRGHKGKGKEVVDKSSLGEWVVNIDEMDSGLNAYGERERVILVIGVMPVTTKDVIISSGNFSDTLFILAPTASLSIESGYPPSSDGKSDSQTEDDSLGRVKFEQLPPTPEFDTRTNAVEGYRRMLQAAQRVAGKWRGQRKMASPAALWVRENHNLDSSDDVPPLSPIHAPNHTRKRKSTSYSRSISFNLLSSAPRDPEVASEVPTSFDAIITYLPLPQTPESEACVQAILRQFCAATTAISPIFNVGRPTFKDGTPTTQSATADGCNNSYTTLIYVLPERFPTNLPRTLQSCLSSILSAHSPHQQQRAFLLKEKTLDRKMQRQEDRYPITGLEIILSNSLHWIRPVSESQQASANIYLEDFKQCRFAFQPRIEEFCSSSTNASISSLSNTATTEGEPLTPTLSNDEDCTLDRNLLQGNKPSHGMPHSFSAQSHDSIPLSEMSAKSTKKTPFLRRIFSGDRVR